MSGPHSIDCTKPHPPFHQHGLGLASCMHAQGCLVMQGSLVAPWTKPSTIKMAAHLAA